MHRYRKAKLHTIGVGWDDDSANQIHPLLGLLDILKDQESKLYPRFMEINPRSYDPGDDKSYLSEQQEEAGIERSIEQHGEAAQGMPAKFGRDLF